MCNYIVRGLRSLAEVRVHDAEARVEVGEAGSASVLQFDRIFRDDQQEPRGPKA